MNTIQEIIEQYTNLLQEQQETLNIMNRLTVRAEQLKQDVIKLNLGGINQ